MHRVGILSSHPIQYQAPWFRELAKVVDLEVFFAHRQSAAEQGKAGFGVAFEWDVDLLSGYKYRFLENVSANPSVNYFGGCDTPEIAGIIGKAPRFDTFIVNGWYLKCYLQAAQACRRAGVPVLVRGDSQLGTPRSALKRLAMEVRQRWLLRKFDGFLSVGRRHQEYLEHFGVKRDRIFFAPHFVDNDWFAAKAAEGRTRRLELRRTWGADDATLVILFVGKFQPLKRPMDLLQALSTISRQPSSPKVQLVFVGAGELENEMRAFVDRNKLPVHFAGFKNQTEMPAIYAAGDALVLPSDSETWGMVVNEAMACGLPVIASEAVGSTADLVEEGRTGFMFPTGDAAALADRLRMLARLNAQGHDFCPALAAKMRVYSLQTAVTGTVDAVKKFTAKN